MSDAFIVRPLASVAWLVRATLVSAVSHQDSNQAKGGNQLRFHRTKRLVQLPATPSGPLTQRELDRVQASLPFPSALAAWFTPLSAPQYLAVALVAQFILLYGAGEGEGLFTGEERYAQLARQLAQTAQRADTLHAYWSDLCASLQVAGAIRRSEGVLALLTLQSGAARTVIAVLAQEVDTTVLLAREWVEATKNQNPEYAQKSGRETVPAEMTIPAYEASNFPPAPSALVRNVASLSGNSIRHSLVREPGMRHLLTHLGIGARELPQHVGVLLGAGGAIREGAKGPDVTKRASLGQEICGRYPFLELVGGCVDTFLLPPSTLKVNAWLVCSENARALGPLGIVPSYPAEALLEQEQIFRLSAAWGEANAIINFETLVEGAEIAFLFTLSPYASSLARGALAAALSTVGEFPYIGGQSARGFGRVLLQLPENEEFVGSMRDYHMYLDANAEVLRAGLLDGTLGTDQVVCAV